MNGLTCSDELRENYHLNLQLCSTSESFLTSFSSLFSCSVFTLSNHSQSNILAVPSNCFGQKKALMFHCVYQLNLFNNQTKWSVQQRTIRYFPQGFTRKMDLNKVNIGHLFIRWPQTLNKRLFADKFKMINLKAVFNLWCFHKLFLLPPSGQKRRFKVSEVLQNRHNH